jgi:hypothetical protein
VFQVNVIVESGDFSVTAERSVTAASTSNVDSDI